MSDLKTALAMAEEEVRKALASVDYWGEKYRKASLHLNHVMSIRDAIEKRIKEEQDG